MRVIALLVYFTSLAGFASSACRDCAFGSLGGPADNRFVIFDAALRSTGQGAPEILVNTATLNLHLRIPDLSFGSGGLVLERSFNLDDTRGGPFGPHWTFNLAESVTLASDGQSCTLRRGSGRVDLFAAAAQPGRFFAVTRTASVLERSADGGWRLSTPGSAAVRTFRPDGQLAAIDDGASRVTLEYDPAGRLLGTRTLGRRIDFTWDDAGRIAAIADSAGRKVVYTYTAAGLLASWTSAGGGTSTLDYDASGLPVSLATPAGTFSFQYAGDDALGIAAIGLPGGAARQYGAPAPREVRVFVGESATTYSYTATGLIDAIAGPAGNVTSFVYDAAGRRTRVTNAAGETVRFDYDAAGNLAAVIDSANNRWTADYNSAGKPVRLTEANGKAWQFRYDAAGNLAAVVDPAAGTASAVRNASGLVTSIAAPNGSRTAFQYDPDGLPVAFTDALGATWKWEYDGAARVAARTDPSGAVLKPAYDARNRVAAVASAGEILSLAPALTRDAFDRVTASTDPYGNTLQYSYDAAGRLSSIAFPAGAVSYEYDDAGRLAKVADWLGNFAVYRYDAAGSIASLGVSGGPVTLYQYDAARNLRAIVVSGSGGELLAAYRYTRDANGNRTAATALEPSGGPAYSLAASRAYDAANRPAASDDGAAYRYDSAGRLVSVDGAHPAALAYDAFGRLASFTIDGAATAYAYDAAGLRVECRRDGDVRRYVYDMSAPQPRPVMETDGDNNPLAWYVYGAGLLWKIDAAGRTWFYHFDGGGNTVAVSGAASGVANRYRYDPLGALSSPDETVENSFRARGQAGWIDDGNGLLYTGAAFEWPAARVTLPAAPDLQPPAPDLLPRWRGAAARFFEGVASCGFAAGRTR